MATTVETLSAGAEQIAAQLRRVAALRRRQAEIQTAIANARTAFEESIRVQTDEAKRISLELVSAEGAVRAMTLAHYEETKEPKPTAGVQVKLFKELVYDTQKADEWTR